MANFYNNLNNQRQRFVEVFEDTRNLIATDYDLIYQTYKGLELMKLYDVDTFKEALSTPQPTGVMNNVMVTPSRTYEAAGRLKQADPEAVVTVLNFASATNPGGGVLRGSSAQEECLCRASNLYSYLITKKADLLFYQPNRAAKAPLHDDKIIYTPNVTVFKTDDKTFTLLPKDMWYQVDVITCAAPNLREQPSNQFNQGDGDVRATVTDEELYKIHYSRANAIVRAAIDNKTDYLVLGAFGCGAFKNNPKVVAKAYYDLLKKYYIFFKGIEFAVYCNSYEDENFKAFKEQFKEERN